MTLEEIVSSALQQLEDNSPRMDLNEFGRWIGRSCTLAHEAGELEDPPPEGEFVDYVTEIVLRLVPDHKLIGPPLESM